MNINEYFEEVQEYIKKTVQNPEEIDELIKELQKDNLQAVVNKNFNNGLSIEECGEMILKSSNIKGSDNSQEPNQINGDRALNKMERKIMKYSEFVNENLKYIIEDELSTAIEPYISEIGKFKNAKEYRQLLTKIKKELSDVSYNKLKSLDDKKLVKAFSDAVNYI
ncbi:MAG: hypothetical protein HPY57_14035 [Ignavibacteria bacterium]|nr:hypothetical protein [Ignavibacteria bacterium]